MEIEETILTWRRLLLADLLWDDLGLDGKTLILQLRSLVAMSGGKDAPPQGELDCIFIFSEIHNGTSRKLKP